MKRSGILLVILACFVSPMILYGQQSIDFPRDTSFSVWSSAQKIRKDFPHAVPVKEFNYPQILTARETVYGSAGKRDLHMDVFWPEQENDRKHPGVICIHGGGWASGNKSHLVPLAQKLAQSGYLAASVEYRLSPEAKYPAGVCDIKDAIRYLKVNADKYKLDTTRIAILGTSAGATLASLIGTSSSGLQAIVNIDGVLDFTDPAESGKDSDPEKPSAAARWFGYTYKENPGIWIEASPNSYVDESSPPTLFINSAIPRFHAGREIYLEVLERNGIYYQVHTVPETPHPFWLFHPWFDETITYIENFLGLVFE